MNLTKKRQAFTLTELLVWITVMSIILLSATNMNFNRLNTKQELDIFTNNIKSNFEMIRNSSLSWKWIWNDLALPEKWKIEYSTSNSWTIINSATFDWTAWTNLDISPKFKQGFSISEIWCLKLDEDENEDITSWTWTIEFIWSNLILWGCADNTSKILRLTIKYKAETELILLNTLNWLAEIK